MIQKLAKTNIYLATSILLLVPFHAILSIVAYTIFGHYTLTRLFEEYILLCMVLSGVYIFIKDFKNQKKLLDNKLVLLILGYLTLLILFAILGYLNKSVNLKATFYGLLLDSRYLIYFLLIYQSIKSLDINDFKKKINIFKLILIPAALVIGFGLLQVFLLPYDFLAHLGYSKDTIHAYYVVNNNYKYIRILSTLRGPNPLGAYIIFPAIFILSYIVKNKRDYKNYLLV